MFLLQPEVDEDGFTVVRGTGVTRSADGLAVKGYRVPTAATTAVDYGELFGGAASLPLGSIDPRFHMCSGIGHGVSQQRKLEKKRAKKMQVSLRITNWSSYLSRTRFGLIFYAKYFCEMLGVLHCVLDASLSGEGRVRYILAVAR